MRIYIALFAMLLTWPLQAGWITAQGSAQIMDGDIHKAREEAIAQAISYASLQTGISVSSQQQVTDGRLTMDQFTLTSSLNNPNIQIISESIRDDLLSINLKIATRDDSTSQCMENSIKAAILLPQSLLSQRQQLSYGQLLGFESALSAQLGQIIDKQSRAAFTHLHADDKLDLNQALADTTGYSLPTWLTEHTDSQYLLLPTVKDLSVLPAQSSLLGLWQHTPLRNFSINLALYHGISGEKIWSQNYHTQAEWSFPLQASVPPAQSQFWDSEYGQKVSNTLSNAVRDIDNTLFCRPVLGQVVARDNTRIILNLGRKHGVHPGDKFKLVQQQQITDRYARPKALAHENAISVTIDQVTEMSATAPLSAAPGAQAIQLNDLTIKQ
ncbi:MAG: flagellar assembly protein FlgT [Shewanella sp.]|nr:flagellar assembly protein FlgT [Shewanella sp.]MCF1429582.1 flagellar assembly protein FlgT [Shewanella sp.]MCF1438010.1 flagellar assembly protein FlgT [Shewanella sp.]MCF1457017.1 flagellar assembly protein FlgT [Shewanella sp.]